MAPEAELLGMTLRLVVAGTAFRPVSTGTLCAVGGCTMKGQDRAFVEILRVR